MAKRKKKQAPAEGVPAWMITFTDLMTLLLTFFVLLVSMATLDEQRKLVTLGSVLGKFGMGDAGIDARSTKNAKTTIEPGPMEDVPNLERLKDLLWEDLQNDLDFRSNKFIEVLSLTADVLFEPGGTTLSARGRQIIDRILPVLLRIEQPLLLAGHTSVAREELANYVVAFEVEGLDFSWDLSLLRVLSMYRYLLSRGMNPDKLRMEAFGQHRPVHTNQTAEGRRRNRRVDIVLDKRNANWERVLAAPRADDLRGVFEYKDFRFEIRSPVRREASQNELPQDEGR
ncbi:MAG: OmpA family protein [Desulfovibrio sp.]|nr:OmpA family protein [Desulfovibrio sp.]MCA1986400.1 OmpA family protein [Desulfovibrio sp.]